MDKKRRDFIGKSAFGLFGILPFSLQSGIAQPPNTKKVEANLLENKELYSHFPTQDPDVVKQVVGAAHTQFDVVKELVSARPELAKSTYDWGFGDWESALGAASHMGRKDIAEFLMGHGARPNIFTFAMLGNLKAVKHMIEDMPGVQKIKGPHGFTLMDHAQMRLRRKNVEGKEKENQEELVDYLNSLGDANIKAISLDITKDEQKVYFGTYRFGETADAYFKVSLNGRGILYMSRGEYTGRSLLRIDTNSFAPGGAPSVRVQFEVVDGLAQSVTVHDPSPIVKAIRI